MKDKVGSNRWVYRHTIIPPFDGLPVQCHSERMAVVKSNATSIWLEFDDYYHTDDGQMVCASANGIVKRADLRTGNGWHRRYATAGLSFQPINTGILEDDFTIRERRVLLTLSADPLWHNLIAGYPASESPLRDRMMEAGVIDVEHVMQALEPLFRTQRAIVARDDEPLPY